MIILWFNDYIIRRSTLKSFELMSDTEDLCEVTAGEFIIAETASVSFC